MISFLAKHAEYNSRGTAGEMMQTMAVRSLLFPYCSGIISFGCFTASVGFSSFHVAFQCTQPCKHSGVSREKPFLKKGGPAKASSSNFS